jgi:Zn-dependent protease
LFDFSRETVFEFLIRALVLFTAMPVHEFAHAYVATRLGDSTPGEQGRLTLNPFAHLEVFGSVMLFFTGFGWAKPVQVDIRNFKRPRIDMGLTSLAGPTSNLLMALLMIIIFKLILLPQLGENVPEAIYMLAQILETIAFINMSLAVFNLLPAPPLDGSKIFGLVLPEKIYYLMLRYDRIIAGVLMALLLFTDILDGPLRWLTVHLYWLLDLITAPLGRLWTS